MPSLYIHIPFCSRKCFYCSFVVAVAKEHHADRYVDCVLGEARRYRGETIGSLYVGGGTPSLLTEAQLRKLFDGLAEFFDFVPGLEITLEANPETMYPAKAEFLLSLGVNRVSLGVQTCHEKYLRWMGRTHTAEQSARAVTALKAAPLKNINVDLMYSFPEETLAELESDVKQLADLDCAHVSLYSLSVEPHSRFFSRGVQPLPRDTEAVFYEEARQRLVRDGYGQYEISNFCRPGMESFHNKNYWLGGDYIGLGVGAHSHRHGRRSWNTSQLKAYMTAVEKNVNPEEGYEMLTSEQQFREAIAFGLRMNQGVDVRQLEERYRVAVPESLEARVGSLIQEGWLDQESSAGGRLWKVTDRGRLVLDTLMPYII
ncbi:MAG TPA: radical SAM family heme chaperone HemW [Candidatus Omnitrophota bacterium]|nr:radical SAM family heme chaperone HemW [Candidatus Omnitrophota bacterium]HQO57781.1 radical SAM family heme chaperone HemW [Candidatus Omnitrophota bacterium]HQP11442.1 radical SAM family heme chaperone HemW [Candidatus Omnitrophota bacterium]